jgi:hypothetical protein
MWLGILLLIALGVYIVWDSRRLRSEKPVPLPREALSGGFMPKGLVKWQVYLGLGGVTAMLAFLEWEQPSKPPFTGRWSWLYQALFEALGTRGLFMWWALIASVCLGYGFLLLRRERS